MATNLLEVRANGEDLVDEVFNREDVVFAELLLNHGVGGKRNALLVDLSVSPLVDQLAHGLQVRLPANNEKIRTNCVWPG